MKLVLSVLVTTLLITQLSSNVYETHATPLPFPSYTLAVDNLEFRIMYDTQLGSATISQIELDQGSNSLLITLDRKEQTDDVLSLYLPRYLIESKVNGTDTPFNVLVNGKTILNKQQSNEMEHYLAIPLKPDTSRVKIIGTETLSITYDTTTLSIKDCCFWASTDKTVYFPSEEMILKGNVAKKVPSLIPIIYISRDNEVVTVFDIPEEKFLSDTFFSYSLGFAKSFLPGKYDVRMTYGSVSVKTSFSVLAPKIFSADYEIVRTPFQVSLRNQDFTLLGLNHGILIVKPNETAILHIDVTNNDAYEHGINLSLSTMNPLSTVSSYSFEPETLIVKPNSTETALLKMKAIGTNATQWEIIDLFAQGHTFGAIGKAFYLIVGSDVTESDLYFIDKSMREGLPGPAFPFIGKPPELEAEKVIANNFGIPRYLPSNYEFQGITSGYPVTVLVYAPVEITNSTEMIDFWRSGGLLIVYSTEEESFNRESWMPAFIAQNEGKQVIINGNIGVITEQRESVTDEGNRFKFPSQVIFFRDDDMVNLRGNMPEEELLEVAASIPFQVNKKFPIVITELELNSQGYNQADMEALACKGLKQDSRQWIEIHNPSDHPLDLKNIGIELVQGQTLMLVNKPPLQPEEYRVIELSPNLLLTFPTENKSFAVVIFEDSRLQIDSTPELSNSFPDYKTWQKINGVWVFRDATPCATTIRDFPIPPLTKPTTSGDFIVELYWKPDVIDAGKPVTFSLVFRDSKQNVLNDLIYSIVVTDSSGKAILQIKNARTMDGQGIHETTSESAGSMHIMITFYRPQGTGILAEPITERVDFDLMVVPEFPFTIVIASVAIGVMLFIVAVIKRKGSYEFILLP